MSDIVQIVWIVCGTALIYPILIVLAKCAEAWKETAKQNGQTERHICDKDHQTFRGTDHADVCASRSVANSLSDALRAFFPKGLKYIKQEHVDELRQYISERYED